MEKKKKPDKSSLAGRILIGFGCALLLIAIILICRNSMESDKAAEETMRNLPGLKEEILASAENSSEKKHVNPYDLEETEKSKEMTVKNINGSDYIGYLSIPDFELELPVMADWSYPSLQVAPCRQFGSTKSDDLVIAAHNYESHFGHLKDLEQGNIISFTDMDGETAVYIVDSVGVIPPDAIETVQHSGYDLVLYTCTYGGANRVMAGCYRGEKEQAENK